MYEEGTYLYRMLHDGKISPIDEETSILMYSALIDKLKDAGYEHYEISNFAKPGKRSIHNSSYWNDVPYIGLGAAAHSYNISTRSWNIADVKQYINDINNNKLPADFEQIDQDTHYNDLIATSLRTSDGLDLAKLDESYKKYALDAAAKAIDDGYLHIESNRLKLTRQGLMISDYIMSELVKV